MANHPRRHSCRTAAGTREWMEAIAGFLRPFKPLLDAHVVNFFKDRVWEMVDEQWMDSLRKEPMESILRLPSGFVQDYWPQSLQEFVRTLRSLVLPREPNLEHPILCNVQAASLGSVLVQGMNSKKKHEVGQLMTKPLTVEQVEILAAVISSIANWSGAQTIVDVGSGQGYLAQALSFQYQLSVIAIDASLHHATVTNSRAERIRKHYAAKLRKSQYGSAGNQHLRVPKTVTCDVLSSDTLTALSIASVHENNIEKSTKTQNNSETGVLESPKPNIPEASLLSNNPYIGPALVLAGLHACGDLSVNMLRTFVDCERVKALVSIGCCYNLLSEDSFEKNEASCGFPMSNAAKLYGLILGKNVRDLACQSAERWRSLTKDAAVQNFEVHAFRAAFQRVLDKYFPEVLRSSPSIGRQGKALRRQQFRKVIESRLGAERSSSVSFSICKEQCQVEASAHTMKPDEVIDQHYDDLELRDDTCTNSNLLPQPRFSFELTDQGSVVETSNKYMLFKYFCKSGLDRLGCAYPEDIDLLGIWTEAQPFIEFIGPFWSLRAALGPLVETYILLDRLLFLQEQGDSVEASLLPLFDPTLSPRNVAIIAHKTDANVLLI